MTVDDAELAAAQAVLKQALSSNGQEQKQAEKAIRREMDENPDKIITLLAFILQTQSIYKTDIEQIPINITDY